MFDPKHPIKDLVPASYNPRHCSDDGIERLQESIRTLGVVKPVIVRGKTLVAGHQRTKALKLMGETTVPAFLLASDVNTLDEVRFNQLHNGTDLDSGDENCQVAGGVQLGFQIVEWQRVSGDQGASFSLVRQTIEQLVRRYGPWGAVVATQSGKIIHCAQYALAAMNLRVPLMVYGIPDSEEERYSIRLNGQYGVFSYSHLEKHTYIQTLAQPRRRVGKDGEKGHLQSSLYTRNVIPYVGDRKRMRMIDFGAGTGVHAADLREKGYDILDVELFRRMKGREAIDVAQVNRMIDNAQRSLSRRGPFDVVICDSVINSVDSLDAEKAVMTTLNALCRMNGRVFFSGRTLELVKDKVSSSKSQTLSKETMHLEFLDEHGFTGYYRLGHWFYQKYHDAEGAQALAEMAGLRIDVHRHLDSEGFGWQIIGTKVRELDPEQVKWALEFEFNMPVSKTRRLARHADMIEAWQLGQALDVGAPEDTSAADGILTKVERKRAPSKKKLAAMAAADAADIDDQFGDAKPKRNARTDEAMGGGKRSIKNIDGIKAEKLANAERIARETGAGSGKTRAKKTA